MFPTSQSQRALDNNQSKIVLSQLCLHTAIYVYLLTNERAPIISIILNYFMMIFLTQWKRWKDMKLHGFLLCGPVINILSTPDNILLTAFMRFCPGGPWNCTEKSKIIISLIYIAPTQWRRLWALYNWKETCIYLTTKDPDYINKHKESEI